MGYNHREETHISCDYNPNSEHYHKQLTANLQGNGHPQSSQLTEPLWTDPWTKRVEMVCASYLHLKTNNSKHTHTHTHTHRNKQTNNTHTHTHAHTGHDGNEYKSILCSLCGIKWKHTVLYSDANTLHTTDVHHTSESYQHNPTCSNLRLVANHANGATVHASKANHNVACIVWHDLKELVVVHDLWKTACRSLLITPWTCTHKNCNG